MPFELIINTTADGKPSVVVVQLPDSAWAGAKQVVNEFNTGQFRLEETVTIYSAGQTVVEGSWRWADIDDIVVEERRSWG